MLRWMWICIDEPSSRLDQAAGFWAPATGTCATRPDDGDQRLPLVPATGDVCLQLRAVNGQGGATVDIGVDALRTYPARMRALGGTIVTESADRVEARSPSGMAFGLVPCAEQLRRPPAFRLPGGSATSLDQICIDIAPSHWDTEVEFWTHLTGWKTRGFASNPEFTGLVQPAGFPVTVLLQRLDEERSPSSAHLDFSCQDVEASQRVHEGLGARTVEVFPGWTVMTDPVGRVYCLTSHDPT